jgi:transcriptional regulator with XRE-family HTH domain
VGRTRISDIDRFVGYRVKELRLLAGMTQRHLAAQLGVSPVQVYKIETGNGRVAAAGLLLIARFFEVPVAELFEGYHRLVPRDPLSDPETVQMLRDLMRAFLELEPKHQEALARLARALAAES